MPRVSMGIDVGGTFTDLVLVNQETGEVSISKAPSTPRSLVDGVVRAIRKGGVDLASVAAFVHGTTIGTNTAIERNGAQKERPVSTLLSGPAGGVVAGAFFGKLAGFDNVITLDMGGTSCDVSLVYQGSRLFSTESEIEWGIPVKVPMLDVKTIGAGGGSIAWLDKGGLLKVGPQSAGADPGPACYGQGGENPTITDADLVLGLLNPDYFLGGDMRLDVGRATRAVQEKVRVVVRGSELVADYTGSSPQVKGPINCPFGVTASATYNAVLQLTDPTIPTNGGCFRPIHVIAPARSITNVEFPGAQYGGNTETHNRVLDAVMGALAQAIPHRVTGTEGGTCVNLTYGGIHPETGEQYANYQWEGVGWGGRSSADGYSVTVAPVGNSRFQGVEVTETRFPWLVREYSLLPDSGGPGRFRGGLGSRRVMQVAAPDIEVNGLADRHLLAPPGRFGGREGGRSAYFVRFKGEDRWKTVKETFGTKSESKFANCPLHEGDMIMVISPGGGGYGDPRERDRERVLEDLTQGYITVQAAIEVFGLSREEAEGAAGHNPGARG